MAAKADPRQLNFLDNYLNPDSETYANAYQSALKAGYSEDYSKVINNRSSVWLSENVKEKLGESKLVEKALGRLEELLEDREDKKVVADLTKFVLKTKGQFSEKTETEHTGELVIKWQEQ